MQVTKLTKIILLSVGALSSPVYADIPEDLKFCNLSNVAAQIKVLGRTNADFEVDGGHGPNTKNDVQIPSGECRNIKVLEEETPSCISHTELTLQLSEYKNAKWEAAEKFNLNSDPGNISKCSGQNNWTPRSYSHYSGSELHLMFPSAKGGYYDQNYANYTLLGTNTVFDLFRHAGGRNSFYPAPQLNEQYFYIYQKRLNNMPAKDLRNFIDLNFQSAYDQIKKNNLSSFFYPTMGLLDKAKYRAETTAKMHSEHFNLNKVCDVNYTVNDNLAPETILETYTANTQQDTSKFFTIAEFKGSDAERIELTPEWREEVINTDTTTTTSIGSLALGYKFKQSGGFKLVANAEVSYEANFKMIGETSQSETHKTHTIIRLPRMEVLVPPKKKTIVMAQIGNAVFNGKFYTRYPVKNAFAKVIINKSMDANCDDANYMLNISDMMKLKGLVNQSIFSSSESDNTIYVQDKFDFNSVAGYKLIITTIQEDLNSKTPITPQLLQNPAWLKQHQAHQTEVPFAPLQNHSGIKLQVQELNSKPTPAIDRKMQINPF